MAAIVYQTNKKTGITYVYESISHWDKEKKQSRAKRKCIGKLDPETKEIIPTNKGDKAKSKTKRTFSGATQLFDLIGEKLGITNDLKKCFPDIYDKILSVAYFLILEPNNPLSRFTKWAATHKHPYDENISSQRSSELFASISEDKKEDFFKLQGKRRIEKEYLAYDTTSISSYSKCLKQLKYGLNKDHDQLPQINLALLFGEESNLPFYYRKLPGNISDVMTVKNLLADLDFLGHTKTKLVMDRGFYSEKNINALYQSHLKFLISTKTSLKFVKNEIDNLRNDIRGWQNYNRNYDVYTTSKTINWDYSQERPNKKDVLNEKRRMYFHLYYNGEKAITQERNLNIQLSELQKELESEKRNLQHEKLYLKYFDIKSTPKKGTQVTAKQEVILEAKKNYGYFVLLSNDIKDPIKALEIYRNKDLVEKAFGNLKERLNFNRLAVSSDQSLDGKLFVEFIALIYLSYIKKVMQDKELFKKYTMQELFDELDIIECFEKKGKKLRFGETTKSQQELLEDFGVFL